MAEVKIPLALDKIEPFCRKWRIVEFALLGSVLREGFRPDSDVDVLVALEPDAPRDLWDLVVVRDGLRQLFGREGDLVKERSLRNPFRRHAILRTRKVICAA